MFGYSNISSEAFVFIIESLYLCIFIIVLSNIYFSSMNSANLYLEYIKIYYGQIFIYSSFIKKLNIKSCIIYRCTH
jgi:hypothetical protein